MREEKNSSILQESAHFLKDYKSLHKCKRVSARVSARVKVSVSVDYHEIMREKQWKRRERENLYDRHKLFSKGHD